MPPEIEGVAPVIPCAVPASTISDSEPPSSLRTAEGNVRVLVEGTSNEQCDGVGAVTDGTPNLMG